MSSNRSGYGDPRTRRKILLAAWELVEERGEAVRLADAATRAGVSRQSVYLHFGDRSGLLVAMVEYIDEVLGAEDNISHIVEAPSGVEALRRMVEALSTFTAKIDRVARVLEAGAHRDPALAAAWRDRLAGRQAVSRAVVQRIADDGGLADEWTVETAAHVLYIVTLPGAWRELTQELGWSSKQYAARVTTLLQRSLLSS